MVASSVFKVESGSNDSGSSQGARPKRLDVSPTGSMFPRTPANFGRPIAISD
jgi:hypothetical protein